MSRYTLRKWLWLDVCFRLLTHSETRFPMLKYLISDLLHQMKQNNKILRPCHWTKKFQHRVGCLACVYVRRILRMRATINNKKIHLLFFSFFFFENSHSKAGWYARRYSQPERSITVLVQHAVLSKTNTRRLNKTQFRKIINGNWASCLVPMTRVYAQTWHQHIDKQSPIDLHTIHPHQHTYTIHICSTINVSESVVSDIRSFARTPPPERLSYRQRNRKPEIKYIKHKYERRTNNTSQFACQTFAFRQALTTTHWRCNKVGLHLSLRERRKKGNFIASHKQSNETPIAKFIIIEIFTRIESKSAFKLWRICRISFSFRVDWRQSESHRNVARKKNWNFDLPLLAWAVGCINGETLKKKNTYICLSTRAKNWVNFFLFFFFAPKIN